MAPANTHAIAGWDFKAVKNVMRAPIPTVINITVRDKCTLVSVVVVDRESNSCSDTEYSGTSRTVEIATVVEPGEKESRPCESPSLFGDIGCFLDVQAKRLRKTKSHYVEQGCVATILAEQSHCWIHATTEDTALWIIGSWDDSQFFSY